MATPAATPASAAATTAVFPPTEVLQKHIFDFGQASAAVVDQCEDVGFTVWVNMSLFTHLVTRGTTAALALQRL